MISIFDVCIQLKDFDPLNCLKRTSEWHSLLRVCQCSGVTSWMGRRRYFPPEGWRGAKSGRKWGTTGRKGECRGNVQKRKKECQRQAQRCKRPWKCWARKSNIAFTGLPTMVSSISDMMPTLVEAEFVRSKYISSFSCTTAIHKRHVRDNYRARNRLAYLVCLCKLRLDIAAQTDSS